MGGYLVEKLLAFLGEGRGPTIQSFFCASQYSICLPRYTSTGGSGIFRKSFSKETSAPSRKTRRNEEPFSMLSGCKPREEDAGDTQLKRSFSTKWQKESFKRSTEA